MSGPSHSGVFLAGATVRVNDPCHGAAAEQNQLECSLLKAALSISATASSSVSE